MAGLDVVTIDGPAGVGKSTLARRVAKALGYGYLDTGAMFRTLALRLGSGARFLSDEELTRRCDALTFRLDGSGGETVLYCGDDPVGGEIRTEEVGAMASAIATNPVVRDALKRAQRRLATLGPLVAEGRDMGTVVFPEAAGKVFLDARPEVRAWRRYAELSAKGVVEDLDVITARIRERDRIDRTRAVAPLRPADDAVVIDTSDLTIDEVLDAILRAVRP